MTTLAMIVAASENDVIGRANSLPWHLPEDLRYFRKVTMGKPLVMGRKTFAAIGRPLPGRANIVVSRAKTFAAEGVFGADSLERALRLAEDDAQRTGAQEIMLIGGAELYALGLPLVARLYLTRVHATVEGDAFLPSIDWQQWRLVEQQDFAATAENPSAYSFQVFDRVVDLSARTGRASGGSDG